jgi:hypothetical protein
MICLFMAVVCGDLFELLFALKALPVVMNAVTVHALRHGLAVVFVTQTWCVSAFVTDCGNHQGSSRKRLQSDGFCH